ncbi:MAG TPA: hypothetical protein VFK05_31435 [Polyangiaceae bacterium]|nr:hypothetical protein [Polyangiaceae bacterium]
MLLSATSACLRQNSTKREIEPERSSQSPKAPPRTATPSNAASVAAPTESPPISDAATSPCRALTPWLAYLTDSVTCEAARCAAAGGACGYGGVACPSACFRKTSDGGQACTDDSQCQSACVTDPDLPVGKSAQGTCHRLAHVMGCENHVRAGRASGALCVE